MNKINGRTPEEIKWGLACCNMHQCPLLECPYFNDELCGESLNADALALIQQLEAERDQYKRERDAAVGDIAPYCILCKFSPSLPIEELNGECMVCSNFSKWQWRGVQEDSHGTK